MHCGNSLPQTNTVLSLSIGIAALVLEGRVLCKDEYADDTTVVASTITKSEPVEKCLATAGSSSFACGSGVQRHQSHASQRSQPPLGHRLEHAVQDIQRLRQKLLVIRSSPSTSNNDVAQQLISVHVGQPQQQQPSPAGGYDSDDELEWIYRQQQLQLHEGNLLKSLQNLATSTCLKTTPRSFNRTQGLLQIVEAWTSSGYVLEQEQNNQPQPSSSSYFLSAHTTTSNVTKSVNVGCDKKPTTKPYGPHCEDFLKSIGLVKTVNGSSSSTADVGHAHVSKPTAFLDPDKHVCSELNANCYRWHNHFCNLVSIHAHGEVICIEVFLGPDHHAILLEQWIIQKCDRTNTATMTLPSLCSAVRSQLYFSQITAWSDLLKSSTADDLLELNSNPRIKHVPHTNTPKLDILYRIRPYDNTSCFNGKPNVHNFPDTVINETTAVKVCLKSLPRQNAIPTLEPPTCGSSSVTDAVATFCNTSIVGQCSSSSNAGYVVATASGSTTQATMMDMRPNNSCVERGKHNCSFDDGLASDEMDASPSPHMSLALVSHRDRQLLKYKKRLLKRSKKKRCTEDTAIDNFSGSSGSSGSTVGHFGCDEPTRSDSSDAAACTPQMGDRNPINSIYPPLYSMVNAMQATLASAKATETVKVEMKSIGTQTDWTTMTSVQNQVDHPDGVFKYPNCDFCGIEMQYVCWNCDNKLFTTSSPRRESTAASTTTTAALSSLPPRSHNNEVDKANLLLQAIQRTPSVKQSNMRRSLQLESNENKTETVQVALTTQTPTKSSFSATVLSPCDGSSNNKSSCDSTVVELSDCRLCKRQKTMHNYFSSSTNSSYKTNFNNNIGKNTNNNNINSLLLNNYKYDSYDGNDDDDDDDDDGGDAVLGECSIGVPVTASSNYHRRTMSESIDAGSSAIFGDDPCPGIELSRSTDERTVLSDLELKMYRRAYSEDVLACGCNDGANAATDDINANRPSQLSLEPPKNMCLTTIATTTPNPDDYFSADNPNCKHQFKTPTTTITQCRTAATGATTNYKINPLYVICPSEYAQPKPIYKKPIPKVNLTKQFSRMPNNEFNDPLVSLQHPASIDLTLHSSSPTLYGNAFNFDNLSPISLGSPASIAAGSLPVHKSNSAPTLPFPVTLPHSLSPRFLKASAILKRRTRHLSDRSSVGSDELFSDEEYGAGLDNTFSPTLTPTNGMIGMRRFGATLKPPFAKCSFGARSLLGSLEESLLQRRLVPKFQVPGFKILLGASGGFCPTQLTIPSATNFYELDGECLSTPYVGEIRMPRKGYSIPRTGTVQATLLNPLGMVVRMFVVPYDFRDMPSMSQTFIRQRVLSSLDERSEAELKKLSSSEQMKLLRYAIHLRFQTSSSGRLALHTDIRILISRRTDCDTAAAHAKGVLESPNELKIVTVVPEAPKFSTYFSAVKQKKSI